MKTYIQIEENCGNEGESWSTFLIKEGNEIFIEKLKNTIIKYDELECYDNYLTIEDDSVDEATVNMMVRKTKSGYYDFYNKCEKILDPSLIDDSSDENFVNSFYKMKYFN